MILPEASRPARSRFDGIYRSTGGEAVFQEACAPTSAELQGLLVKIIARLMKMLTRQGYLVEEQGMTYWADIDPDNPLRSLQAASCTYRIAFCPAGRAEGADLANHLPSR